MSAIEMFAPWTPNDPLNHQKIGLMVRPNKELWDARRYQRNLRSRTTGSAGAIAFFAGVALAGQCMIWMGWIEPGKTPAAEIINYWPGFLFGGLLLGIPAVVGARKIYDMIHGE